MTTTGTFTVKTTNDEKFEVGASYSLTLSVSEQLVGFGVTKLSDPPSSEAPTEESTGVVEGGGEGVVSDAPLDPDSTPPATP